MLEQPDGPARIRTALRDCLARYMELQDGGQHDGPPLVAMRLYEVEWAIDPNAAKIDEPLGRRLIAEVHKQ